MDSAPVSRRAFLAGSAGVAVAVLTAGPAAALLGEKNTAISPLVLSSDLHASPDPQRFVFAIARGSKFASFGPAQLGFVPPGTSGRVSVTMTDTNLYKDGLPKGRGIYVVETAFPAAGVYRGLVQVQGKQVPFQVQVKDAAEAPLVGAQAPRAASPTTANPLGVNPICTRSPACPLHTLSLADVIGNGRPVAAMFATPALCQSQYCGPVLDQLLNVMAPYQAKSVQMVHVEIYDSNKGATLSPTVSAWGLPSEPWLFTIDGNGVIKERLDGAIATNEVKAALDRLIAG